MAHVVVRVEGHEVGAQQPPQHFGAFGQDAEQFVGGEGNVVEVADLQFGAGFPQHARQEHQLVVLHPYDVARLGQPADRLAEKTVHGAVGLAVARLVAGIGEEVVAQGPDRAVAVTFVVVGDLAGGEKDRMETQGLQFVGRLPAALFPVGAESRPADPVFFRNRCAGSPVRWRGRPRCARKSRRPSCSETFTGKRFDTM